MSARRALAALGLLTVLAPAWAWGCAPAAGGTSGNGDRLNPWTIPGVLRIETASVIDDLNPLLGEESIDTDVSMFWSGHLFNWTDDGKLLPELATEVPTRQNGGISADGRTIVYHLRRGVLWQDGEPFDADDVVFTWHAVMNPRNAVTVRQGYDLIDRIDTPDHYTVVVHLARPYAPFVTTFFSMSNTAYPILPKHLLAQYPSINDVPYDRMPIGTGPFRVVAWDGHNVKLVANRRYWRGAPLLKEVDIRVETNDAKILADLRHHDIDLYFDATEHQEPALHDIPGTTTYLYPFNSYSDIGFNLSSPVVSDKRVRQALAYAVDRVELVNGLGNGVNIAADTDQSPSSPWSYAGVRHYPYDPEQARRLLDEAGWLVGRAGIRVKEGQRLRIRLAGTGDAPIERLIAADWRAIGVEVALHDYDPTVMDAPASSGGISASGDFDAQIEGWSNGVDPDDSAQFMCDAKPPAGWNAYRYCNPAVDAAERKALGTNDPVQRQRAYATIQRYIAEDVPMIVLAFNQQQDVVNLDLKNYYPASAVTPFWNTWQLEI